MPHLSLKLLNTPAARQQGFIGWKHPPDDETGLMFVGSENKPLTPFWMKGVPFDLDLIAIDASTGKVIEILALKANDETPITFSLPTSHAVEVRGGWCKDHGVKVGTQLLAPRKVIVNESKMELAQITEQLEQFSKSIPDPKARSREIISWAEKGELEKLGEGASRVVYAVDDKHVLKVLKTKPVGGNQNKLEVETYKCLTDELAARVVNQGDKDGVWIISERLVLNGDKVVEYFTTLGEKALGLAGMKGYKNNGINMLMYAASGDHQLTQDKLSAYANKNPEYAWLDLLFTKVFLCNVEPKDFHRGNWGWRDGTEHPVLLDYGFSTEKFSMFEALLHEQQEDSWSAAITRVKQQEPDNAEYVDTLESHMRETREFSTIQQDVLDGINSLHELRLVINSLPRKGNEEDSNAEFFWWDGDDDPGSFIRVVEGMDTAGTQPTGGVNILVHNSELSEPAKIKVGKNKKVVWVEVEGIESELHDLDSLLSDGLAEGLNRALELFTTEKTPMFENTTNRVSLYKLLF